MVSHIIMVGPTRTATTSVFRHFLMDARVSCSRVKETNFFLDALWNPTAHHELDAYESFFAGTQAPRLEASPLYFGGGRSIAEAIAACVPDAKIIVNLRNPVHRFESVFNHIGLKRDVGFNLTLETFLDQCQSCKPMDVKSLEDIDGLALREGLYGELLSEWQEVFSADRIHIVDFEILSRQPALALEGVYNFMQISSPGDRSLESFNQTQFVKNQSVHRIAMLANNALEPLLNISPLWLRSSLRRAYYAINGDEPPAQADPSVMQRIQRYYEQDAALLKETLNQLKSPPPAWLS